MNYDRFSRDTALTYTSSSADTYDIEAGPSVNLETLVQHDHDSTEFKSFIDSHVLDDLFNSVNYCSDYSDDDDAAWRTTITHTLNVDTLCNAFATCTTGSSDGAEALVDFVPRIADQLSYAYQTLAFAKQNHTSISLNALA